jgi:hypothetical protein
LQGHDGTTIGLQSDHSPAHPMQTLERSFFSLVGCINP